MITKRDEEILIKEYEMKEEHYAEIMEEIEIMIKEIKNTEKLLKKKSNQWRIVSITLTNTELRRR